MIKLKIYSQQDRKDLSHILASNGYVISSEESYDKSSAERTYYVVIHETDISNKQIEHLKDRIERIEEKLHSSKEGPVQFKLEDLEKRVSNLESDVSSAKSVTDLHTPIGGNPILNPVDHNSEDQDDTPLSPLTDLQLDALLNALDDEQKQDPDNADLIARIEALERKNRNSDMNTKEGPGTVFKLPEYDEEEVEKGIKKALEEPLSQDEVDSLLRMKPDDFEKSDRGKENKLPDILEESRNTIDRFFSKITCTDEVLDAWGRIDDFIFNNNVSSKPVKTFPESLADLAEEIGGRQRQRYIEEGGNA